MFVSNLQSICHHDWQRPINGNLLHNLKQLKILGSIVVSTSSMEEQFPAISTWTQQISTKNLQQNAAFNKNKALIESTSTVYKTIKLSTNLQTLQ